MDTLRPPHLRTRGTPGASAPRAPPPSPPGHHGAPRQPWMSPGQCMPWDRRTFGHPCPPPPDDTGLPGHPWPLWDPLRPSQPPCDPGTPGQPGTPPRPVDAVGPLGTVGPWDTLGPPHPPRVPPCEGLPSNTPNWRFGGVCPMDRSPQCVGVTLGGMGRLLAAPTPHHSCEHCQKPINGKVN